MFYCHVKHRTGERDKRDEGGKGESMQVFFLKFLYGLLQSCLRLYACLELMSMQPRLHTGFYASNSASRAWKGQ